MRVEFGGGKQSDFVNPFQHALLQLTSCAVDHPSRRTRVVELKFL